MSNIAIVVTSDFEDSEFKQPYETLRKAGHHVTVIGKQAGQDVMGKRGNVTAHVERDGSQVKAEDFDALVIPGGYSPDQLRTDEEIVRFVQRFGALARPIAAVCHGPQLLIEADLVRGKRMTSWPSVRKDLENAGATWVDQEVCVDGALITSRKPDDLEAFSQAILARLEAP